MNITSAILKQIAPQANQDIIDGLAPALNEQLDKYGINKFLSVAHFLGESAEETAGFKTLNEYGNTAYFTAHYEHRDDLGNTHPGDGALFHGRGIFQLTGRSNYFTMGQKIGIDLIAHPEQAADPDVAVTIACEYRNGRGLNAYALADDIFHVAARINGINRKTGEPNGFADRKVYTAKAKTAIKALFP
jgi:predicted chitinase